MTDPRIITPDSTHHLGVEETLMHDLFQPLQGDKSVTAGERSHMLRELIHELAYDKNMPYEEKVRAGAPHEDRVQGIRRFLEEMLGKFHGRGQEPIGQLGALVDQTADRFRFGKLRSKFGGGKLNVLLGALASAGLLGGAMGRERS